MPARNPYIGFDKDARGVRSLWERFNSGLIDTSERRPAYHQMLLNEWQRCMSLGVDVTMTMARRLGDDEFRQRTHSNRVLADLSIPIIQDVGRFLDEVPGMMILTEHTGCVLHIAGHPRVCDLAAERSGIVKGSQWDESNAGTNGMGTALSARQPVHIFATEHFCEGLQAWSCAASPILDTDGSVLGIIDFTTIQSEHRDQALALCVSMANSIQARMALHRELERGRLKSAFNETARRYPNDDILALDHAGRVVTHSQTDHCRRVADSWTSGGRTSAVVQETVEVTAPDTGARIGKVLLLARPAENGRGVHSLYSGRDPGDAVESVRQFGQFVTRDAETRRMLDELQRVAKADVTVLLLGETGTGKELLARHLHACSARRGEPYLAVNCGAISAELMESTFFGYVRGAFSGADPRGRAGYFETARGGTLFLDEIGELPLAMQAALLRVLEDGGYHRVGSCETQVARCRIVAATHRNLEQLVADGGFRQDLYFRLKVVQKAVKPLRERCCDVSLFVDRFVEVMRQKHALPAIEFTPEARVALDRYDWPGNAREVRNVVEAAMLCSEGPIGVECLPPEILGRPERSTPQAPDGPSEAATRIYEQQIIVGMLRKYRKVNAAARALGMARSTLYRKFAELGIDHTRYTSGTDE